MGQAAFVHLQYVDRSSKGLDLKRSILYISKSQYWQVMVRELADERDYRNELVMQLHSWMGH